MLQLRDTCNSKPWTDNMLLLCTSVGTGKMQIWVIEHTHIIFSDVGVILSWDTVLANKFEYRHLDRLCQSPPVEIHKTAYEICYNTSNCLFVCLTISTHLSSAGVVVSFVKIIMKIIKETKSHRSSNRTIYEHSLIQHYVTFPSNLYD